MSDPLEFYHHDPLLARRMLVMAHWRKTPAELKEIPEEDLELLEQSYLLLERRQVESLDSTLGSLLGVTWDAASVLGEGEKTPAKEFTWSLRTKRPKVYIPLVMSLTQNPKFLDFLKSAATRERWGSREDTSVLNKPKWLENRKLEIVDLSAKPKEEFLKYASRI